MKNHPKTAFSNYLTKKGYLFLINCTTLVHKKQKTNKKHSLSNKNAYIHLKMNINATKHKKIEKILNKFL